MISLPSAGFILTSIFLTSLLSGVVGMAGGMILMGVLVWILPVGAAIILHAVVQFFANATRAFLHRGHIYKRGVLFYLAGALSCLGLFTLVSFVPDKTTVFLVLGCLPFVTALLPARLHANFLNPSHAFACGLLATALHLSAGVAGPVVDVFFQKTGMSRHANVATKALTQCLSHSVKFVYFLVLIPTLTKQEITPPPLLLCLLAIPVAYMGTRASTLILDKITDHHFYRATQLLLLGIGFAYLFKAVSLMLAPVP